MITTEKNMIQTLTEAAVNTTWEYKTIYNGNSNDMNTLHQVADKYRTDVAKASSEIRRSRHTKFNKMEDVDKLEFCKKIITSRLPLVVIGFSILHKLTKGGTSQYLEDHFTKVIEDIRSSLYAIEEAHDDILKLDPIYGPTNAFITTLVSNDMFQKLVSKIQLYYILYRDNDTESRKIAKLYRAFIRLFSIHSDWGDEVKLIRNFNRDCDKTFYREMFHLKSYTNKQMSRSMELGSTLPMDTPDKEQPEVSTPISTYGNLLGGGTRRKKLGAYNSIVNEEERKTSEAIDKTISYYRSLNK